MGTSTPLAPWSSTYLICQLALPSAHAPVAGIHNGLRVFKESGADVIVSVGGGSPVDASKAILYFHQQETGDAYLSQIAIPTTLSAAEYTVSERSRALLGVFRS